MSCKRHTTKQQFAALMKFMKENQMIARGIANAPEYRTDVERLWEDATKTLNALGPPIKTAIAWKKVWKDLKYHTKTKVRQNLMCAKEKDIDGPYKQPQPALSNIEKELIALLDLNTSEKKKLKDFTPSTNLNDLLVEIAQGSTSSFEEAAHGSENSSVPESVLESENQSQKRMRLPLTTAGKMFQVQNQKPNKYIMEQIKLLKKQNKLLRQQSKYVQKKWTHMRDSWTKSVKKQKSKNPPKPYVHLEEMSFLRKDNKNASKDNKNASKDESTDNENEESSDDDKSINKIEEQSASSNLGVISGVKRRHIDVINEVNKVPEEKRQNVNVPQDENQNRHLLFFRGLLPSLALLNDDQTLDFQAGVISLLQKIKSNPQAHFVEFPQHMNSYNWHERDNLAEAPTIKYCNGDDDESNN